MNNLIRINPLSEVNNFGPLADFETLFDRFARTGLRPAWRDLEAVEPQIRMDISEAGNEYVVKAEIPGVKKDDLHVSIDGNMVSISAEIKHEMVSGEGSKLLRGERCYGKTMRSFRLDQEVMEEQAAAKYADGVLELKLPKKNGVTHKEITID